MIDETVLQLFAKQYGVIANRQLVDELRMSTSRVHRLKSAGLLVPVTSSVLRITSSPESFRMRCMAVQLHTAGCGFLSGWTAGRLRGLRGMPTRSIHYTIPERAHVALPDWVSVHRTRWYCPDDDREKLDDGLIVSIPQRMLFSLGAAFNQHRFERAAEDAWHLELTNPTEMADYLERHRCRGKDGVSRIERWLEHALVQRRPAQSGLERELIQSLVHAGLPTPIRQHPLLLPSGETIHLDISWPAIRLAVEPGASWWHGGDQRQRRDQARDRACSEMGWHVLHLDERLRDDLAGTARQIRRIHDRRTRDVR
ncbi:MAG: hypothetical protein QNM02_03640 [Acidimicrobiia bacterium]|nr:hypothetical protein [Acidimicrobiia bacterium]